MKNPVLMLLLITGAFFSCKTKDGNISINGQGNGSQLQLGATDTFTLNAVTIREDSLPGNGLSYALLGNMGDPLLGSTRASVFAALTLLEPNTDFPNTEDPDSAVLFIPIIQGLNFYGNKLTPQSLKIQFLNSDIDASVVYYQNYQAEKDNSMYTAYTGPIYHASYVTTRYNKDTIELSPGLRIKLSTDMAFKLMHLPKAAYQTNEGLAQYLKGISIAPDNQDLMAGTGGIGVFDFHNQLSKGYMAKIMLYYRDTQTFLFTFAGKNRTIVSGSTGPLPAQVQEQLNNPLKSYTATYAQSLQGLKTHVQIPYLLNILQNQPNNLAVNLAELTIAVDKTQFTSDFFAPPRLNLFRPMNANSTRNYLLPDASSSLLGGYYDASNGTYKFVITRYVQDLLNEMYNQNSNQNRGMYIAIPTGSPVLPARVKLNFADPRTKLKITFTRIN